MTTTLEYAQNADESAIRGSVASLHRHALSAPAGLCAGDIIDGKLRVGHVIGSGGMGTVYAAHHLGLDKEVALKVMAGAGDPEAAARFLREARAVAKLETSAVARVLDVGATASGLRYIVMERLHGVDLGALVKSRGALPVREAVSLVLEACAPLEEAHALGIIHRDLKPQNLFLAETRSGRRVLKVLDFGVSSLAGADESLTAHHQVLGTPNFMSPEQLSGARAADARSDVYSLGGCLYALLAANAPARGKSLADIVQSIRNGIPVRLDALRTDVSRELADVVERCLAKDALLRFPTMAALAAALRALSESESTARDESEQHIDDVAILAMQEGLLGLETLHSWQQHFGICADCRELVAVTAPPSSGTITVVAPSSAPGRKLATTAPPVSVAPPSPSISPPVSRTTWIALTVFAIALAALVALGVQPRERPRVGPVPSARMAVVIGASPGAGVSSVAPNPASSAPAFSHRARLSRTSSVALSAFPSLPSDR